MSALQQDGLYAAVLELAECKPFLGICMGMQVLMENSDENGGTECMGYFHGTVRHFKAAHGKKRRLKIPHMGWNNVQQIQPHPLWKNIDNQSMFYFVHSYFVEPENTKLMAGKCSYGTDFAAAIARDNVFAMQCHPEKSAAAGQQLLANFLQWDGA